MTLRLQDILERARLHRTTLEYALKRPDVLPGMPEAEGQGRHRQFTQQQALKLAICCHLVMVGVSLKNAVLVFDFIRHQVQSKNPAGFGSELTFHREYPCEPWTVEIYDCRFIRVWTGPLDGKYPSRYSYLDLESGKATKTSPSKRLVFVEIDLTLVERMLIGEA